MNLWIDIARESLLRTISRVDCVILNDGELKQLTDEPNLVRAARAVLELGPRVVVAKQGEYGSALFTRDGYFALPAYPTADVIDPTGAGDTFAGGFMGYVAAHPDEEIDDELLRRAMAYGTALASFNVEAFGTERVPRAHGRGDRGARRRAAPAARASTTRPSRCALAFSASMKPVSVTALQDRLLAQRLVERLRRRRDDVAVPPGRRRVDEADPGRVARLDRVDREGAATTTGRWRMFGPWPA